MAGDPATARGMYAVLIPDLAHLHGPRHRITIDARIEHARWIGESGNAAAARDMYAGLIAKFTTRRNPLSQDLAEHHAWWTARAQDAK
ncbi:hypothetical protein [Yinghuangia sp. YIM S09857]|uniref:hypothetical protein n=1 Tax=Yinghuangia sp. YIM S09857 TaxID=3436929 RepID=UPI003F530D8F